MELFIFWFIFAVIVAYAASTRGRSGVAWFFISALISPLLSMLLLFIMPNLKQAKPAAMPDGTAAPTPDTHVKCPECRELVFKDATKCRFCGCKLVPQ